MPSTIKSRYKNERQIPDTDVSHLYLSTTNNMVVFKFYDTQDGFNFEIVNLSFLHGDVPCCLASLPYLWYVYFVAYFFCENMF